LRRVRRHVSLNLYIDCCQERPKTDFFNGIAPARQYAVPGRQCGGLGCNEVAQFGNFFGAVASSHAE
jgi:hypothetical protein